jgi:Domain of unknown function (DUF5916)/Carbohydrate family 9 binding domain-like
MKSHLSQARTALLAAGCLALGLAGSAIAQTPQPPQAMPPQAAEEQPLRHFEVAPTSSPIRIDGELDDAGWASATVIDLPFEWFPGDNVTPPVATEALVTFDKENLYVGFRASDPDPGAIRAQLMDRDLVANFVHDQRQGFQFRVNPRGVQVDGVFSEIEGGEDFSWDAIWASAARITDTGYMVEVAVPFRQLRFSRAQGPQTWGFEAFRNYPRNVRHRISSKYSARSKDCTLCQENKINGFQGIAPGRNLEITPTLTATRADTIDDFPDGNLEDGDEEVEPGVTARWGVTPNATLSATINPDFSQVEADALQLTVNRRFALFFPEKRPFFLEGADLYLTPLPAVFTRTVIEPDWGAKLNVKEGKNSLGVFVARDDITNILIPANQLSRFAFLDNKVDTGVVRYRRDIGDRSAIGVLYTGREGDDYHNRVAGLDGFVRFTDSDTVRMQYLQSDTQYPDPLENVLRLDGAIRGDGLSVQYDHFAKVWKGFLRYQDLDELFRADAGFIPRVDVKTGEGQYQRFIYGTRETWYAQASFGVHGLRTEAHDGTLTDQNIEAFATLNGPRQSGYELHVQKIKEFFAGTTFDIDRQIFIFGIKPTGRTRFELLARYGDEIDLDTALLGKSILLNPSLQLRLGSGLDVQVDYARQNLDVDGERAFNVDIAQTKIVYQFNVRTFVRAILQFQDFERGGEDQEDVFGQFLFSYKLNPQTVLFAGYTDTRLGQNQIEITQTNRTFFLKVGYALLY